MLKLTLLQAVITMITLSWTVCANTHPQTPINRSDIFITPITPTLFGVEYAQYNKSFDCFPVFTGPQTMKLCLNNTVLEVGTKGGGNSDLNLDDAIPHLNGIGSSITEHGFSARDNRHLPGNTTKHPIVCNWTSQLTRSFVATHITFGNFYKVASAQAGATCLCAPISHETQHNFYPPNCSDGDSAYQKRPIHAPKGFADS